MEIKLINTVIRRAQYENEQPRANGQKIAVSVNLELGFPQGFRENGSVLIVSRCGVGSPVQKFSIYLEQIHTFRLNGLEPELEPGSETLRKSIMDSCYPVVLQEVQKVMDSLTAVYRIPALQIPRMKRNDAEVGAFGVVEGTKGN